jgi:hypothetical protein
MPDAYLGKNFTTDTVQLGVNAVKAQVVEEAHGGQIDTNRKAVLRRTVVPEGSPAAWTHPNFQVSSWAAKRYLETGNEFYRTTSLHYLDRGLANITGPHDFHALWNGKSHDVVQAKQYQIPEAVTTVEKDGQTFQIPSPHVPLGWGVGELTKALGLATETAKKHEETVANAFGVREIYRRTA